MTDDETDANGDETDGNDDVGPDYARINLEDVDPIELDDVEPTLFSVGYELRPSEMRPNVWRFDAGEATNEHRHERQEEFYVVLEGSFDAELEDGDRGDGDGEREALVLNAGDYLLVPPETWRKLTAAEESWLLVVGAPPVERDDVQRDEE